jgi:hypothetical protein
VGSPTTADAPERTKDDLVSTEQAADKDKDKEGESAAIRAVQASTGMNSSTGSSPIAGNAPEQDAPATLGDILAAPEKYADRDVTPSGLFLLWTIIEPRPDGTVKLSVVEGKATIQGDGSLATVSSGTRAKLEIEPDLAEGLIAKGLVRREEEFIQAKVQRKGAIAKVQRKGAAPQEASPTLSPGWGKYVAILTLRAMKSRYAVGEWACRIVKAEFLAKLDYQRISEQKYLRAFTTYTMGAGEERVGLGDAEEWKKRLEKPFLADVGRAYKNYRNRKTQEKSAEMGIIMGNLLNQEIAAGNAATQAEQNARLRNARPRTVVDGKAMYDNQVELNADLQSSTPVIPPQLTPGAMQPMRPR